jgi:endogenous inhibitor of DNA gyrase (YacG/DUF329 family)
MPARPVCVYCRERPVVAEFRPFCSARCQMADLGKWLTGDYRVAGRGAGDSRADVLNTGAEEQDEHN